jgi:hypothetical protein
MYYPVRRHRRYYGTTHEVVPQLDLLEQGMKLFAYMDAAIVEVHNNAGDFSGCKDATKSNPKRFCKSRGALLPRGYSACGPPGWWGGCEAQNFLIEYETDLQHTRDAIILRWLQSGTEWTGKTWATEETIYGQCPERSLPIGGPASRLCGSPSDGAALAVLITAIQKFFEIESVKVGAPDTKKQLDEALNALKDNIAVTTAHNAHITSKGLLMAGIDAATEGPWYKEMWGIALISVSAAALWTLYLGPSLQRMGRG